MRLLSVLTLCLLFSVGIQSQDFGNYETISEQRAKLQQSITQQLSDKLSVILKQSRYLINVSIESNEVAVDDILNDDSEAKAAAAKAKKQAKKDTTTASTNDANKGSKAQIRPDESADGSSVEDYIVFSKLGLVAPLVDDFNDFQPDGKILLTMGQDGSEPKKIEKKEPTAQRESQTDVMRKMWRIKSSQDIMQNLKSVSVTVFLDERLEPSSRKMLESIILSTDFNLGKIQPAIEIKYQRFQEILAKEKEGIFSSTRDLLDFFAQVSAFLGIVIAALIFGALMVFALRKVEGMVQNYRDFSMAMQSRSEQEQKTEEDGETTNDTGDGGLLGGEGLDFEASPQASIDRFENYLNSHPDRAILIIKQLLNEDGKHADQALSALVQQLENSTLSEIFKKLTLDERNIWKSRLGDGGAVDDIRAANKYISTKVTADILSEGAHTADNELCDLLIAIKPSEAVEFINEEQDYAPYLLNFISSNMLQSLLHSFTGSIEELIDKGLNVSNSNSFEKIDEFKAKLKPYVSYFKVNPLAENLITLLKDAKPSFEKVLYKKLVGWGYSDQVKTLAYTNIPYFILEQLEIEDKNELLASCPVSLRVKYLFSLGDEGQAILDEFAPEGSRARDMMEIEYERLEADMIFLKEIQDDPEHYYSEFLSHTRKELKGNDHLFGIVSKCIDEWIASQQVSQDSSIRLAS